MTSRVEPIARARPRVVFELGRDLADVLGFALDDVVRGPPRSEGPQAEVGLLEIQEERLVEHSGAFEDVATNQDTRSANPVHPTRLRGHGLPHAPTHQQLRRDAEFEPRFDLRQYSGESERGE